MKAGAISAAIDGKDAVHAEGMLMGRELQGRAEALQEGYRAPPRVDQTGFLGAPALPALDGPHERAQNGCLQSRVMSHAITQQKRQGQHPLPVGYVGQDAVDQMRSGLGHEAPTARGTEAPSLAGKGHSHLVAAMGTAHAHEPVGPDAAFEEAAQLPADEGGQVPTRLGHAREERLEVLGQDLTKHGPLRLARPVGGTDRRSRAPHRPGHLPDGRHIRRPR
jgi:hypothetical protein